MASLAGALAGSGHLSAGSGAVAGFDLDAAARLLREPGTEGGLLPQATALLSAGRTRFAAAEGEIAIAAGSVSRLSGRVALEPPGGALAVTADLKNDRIEIAPVGVKEGWRARIAGAVAAQSAPAGSPAATKVYELLPIAAP